MREFLARHRRTIIAAIGLIVPLFLLYVHGRSPRKTTIVEKALMRITGPAQSAAQSMLSGISGLWSGYVALVGVESDNESLRKQIAEMSAETEKARNLETENERLRQELDFKTKRRDLRLVSAHVIGKDLSPYGRVLRVAVDAGETQGLAEGMPVISAMGLVGRILKVSGSYGEVLLTVDARSIVNVRVLDKGVIGTVTGTSSPYNYVARMSYLHRAEPLEVGDLLVTSGHDKLFPPGLHVGVIRSLEERQRDLEYELQVTPSVNFADLEVVQVVVSVEEAPPEPAPAAPRAPSRGGP